jgi:Carboxypeptidase regulatory-like domain
MFYRALIISLFLQATFILSATASPAIQGDVLGTDGKPLRRAEIRIERKDKKSAPITTRTDTKGYYAANGVSAGVYKISVVVDGAEKSAIKVKTTGDNARVDFNMKPSILGKKVKHYVWMGEGTGSHLGGRWVEVDDAHSPIAGTFNSDRTSAEWAREVSRHQTNNDR